MKNCLQTWRKPFFYKKGIIRSRKSLRPYLLIAFSFLSSILYAQHIIKGRVTAGDSILTGATIQVKGTQTATQTDANGNFTISAPPNATLLISSVGYGNEEVAIGNRTALNIQLQSTTQKLSEVVVVGYGTQVKRKLTSAAVSISGEELNKRVATNPVTLLQGQLPGLQVIQGSGEPGNEGVSLRIRGVSTFSGAGNDPLVIIDGLPGNLTVLNPNDIESVTVLKDAASAAIYGSRGANGVIVVKTKKGKGAFSLQYNYNLGISNPTSLPDVISNSAEYMELSNEAYRNSGRQPLYTQAQIDLYRNATDRVKYPNHKWLDDLFQTAYTHNHYLNLSGGKENTSYSLGLGYTDQPGTMIGFEYKKYTMDLGLSSKVNKRITIGTNLQARYGDRKYPPQGSGDMFLSTLAQSPLYPPKSPDGKWIKRAYPNEQGNKNTVALVGEDVRVRSDDYYLQGNLSMDIEILKGLTWENRAGLNYNSFKSNDFRPVVQTYFYNDMSSAGLLDVGTPGLNVGRGDNIYTVYYSQLSYKKMLGDHNVSAFGGFQQEHNQASNLNAGRTQFTTNLLRELNAGPTNGMTNNGTSSEWAIRSLYGNVNYDFQDKYLLGSSIRYDGTSRLPEDTRWGLFYSFSGGWRISKESFLQDVRWLNDLKIRGSWGQLGNQNIGTYPYQPTLSNRDYVFGGTISPGYSASTLVDPGLTWETTRVIDIGMDLTAFNNKFSLTADWFNKYTFDILRTSQVPLWLGLNAPTINDGAVRNKGLEFSAQFRDRIINDFSYNVGVNFQTYKNTLEEYGKTEIGNTTIREEGHPLDEYYLYVWDGIFQSQEEIDKSPKQPVTPTPGDLKIKDISGDGIIDDKDRTYISGKYPSYQYAVNLGANWRNVDFSAQLYGSEGQKTYVTGWGIEPFRQGSVPTTDWRNRWTPTNPTNSMPKIYVADSYAPVQNYRSTYFLKDASFLRLKNIQVGYTLPTGLVAKAGMKSARIYFSADNVKTFSKYPGLDPERGGDGNYVTYPQIRTFIFGANVQF
ncbi:TonB-dependent receptor [Chitinophagaceae bacterium LB-8]|uniref:TonB-dependent receptor n=1 Tax=Paraflavisolibacter caeni TaxID=2982496 RepID=A0A9X3B702_9BACT|nr:TonB-dependent receptor [Paraflavisolibacter caeni]MCU7547971.1 TonB-dependent receptor [Paraflavisolibacter caeni]